jgi:hypothetical protein
VGAAEGGLGRALHGDRRGPAGRMQGAELLVIGGMRGAVAVEGGVLVDVRG